MCVAHRGPILTLCFKAMGWAKMSPQDQLSSSIDQLSSRIDKLTSAVDRLANAIRDQTAAHVEIATRGRTLNAIGRVQSAWRALQAGDRTTAARLQLNEEVKVRSAAVSLTICRRTVEWLVQPRAASR